MATSKNRRKWWLVILLLVIGTLLYFNNALTNARKESRHRTHMAVILRDGITDYYGAHHSYPEDLSILQLQYGNLVEKLLKAGVLEYKRDPSGTKWFLITCRFSGLLSTGRENYSMSQSGIQYINDISMLPLPAGENASPDRNGFFPADFH